MRHKKRRLLNVLSLALQNFATSKELAKEQSNGRCLRRVDLVAPISVVPIHTAWASNVARSSELQVCEDLAERDE